MLTLDPKTTALVLIDLQAGIMGMPLEPHSSADVLARSTELAKKFRAKEAPVVLVHVDFAADGKDRNQAIVDEGTTAKFPPGFAEFVPGLVQPSDIIVTKRQWGAFYGTDLELQLRRRGVTTIVLGGVATNFGVESTARPAWEMGFNVVIVEDCCASRSKELHEFPVKAVFPRISRVVKSADVALS